jgi:ribosome-associated protein
MSGKVQSQPDIAARCRNAVVAVEDRKGQNLRVLELSEISSLADYFLICSGNSERQVQAIADAVVERLRADKVRPHHIEGYQPGRWVLLDYGDFVVHVFDDSTRAFYALEKLWADAPDVTAEFVQ